MKTIGINKNLSTVHPQHCLITICKSYLKPHLDYGDLLYDKPNNESICQKLEVLNSMLLLASQVASKAHLR